VTGGAVAPSLFLKLGGALLTNKGGHEAVRREVLDRVVAEVADWHRQQPWPLVLAHGSGSFAHVAVRDTGFADHPGNPLALARVAAAARRLNSLVVDTALAAGLGAVAVPGSLLAVCAAGTITEIRSALVTELLAAGLLPVVYGDAAPDRRQGGAVASTEALLVALADALSPSRIVLATDVDGVYPVDPHRDPAAVALAELTPADGPALAHALGGARPGTTDVTGGMAGKVMAMLDLVARHPGLEVRIVSGLRPGAIAAALGGGADAGGTRLTARP